MRRLIRIQARWIHVALALVSVAAACHTQCRQRLHPERERGSPGWPSRTVPLPSRDPRDMAFDLSLKNQPRSPLGKMARSSRSTMSPTPTRISVGIDRIFCFAPSPEHLAPMTGAVIQATKEESLCDEGRGASADAGERGGFQGGHLLRRPRS